MNEVAIWILTAVFILIGGLGIFLSSKIHSFLSKYLKEDEIEKIASACVGIVERQTEGMTSEEKFSTAAEKMVSLLADKGITVSEGDIKVAIENACNVLDQE